MALSEVVARTMLVVVEVECDVLVLYGAGSELIEHGVCDVGEQKMFQVQRVVATSSCKTQTVY